MTLSEFGFSFCCGESCFGERRVEQAVARWLPRRPGRAGFSHPVLPVDDSPENTGFPLCQFSEHPRLTTPHRLPFHLAGRSAWCAARSRHTCR